MEKLDFLFFVHLWWTCDVCSSIRYVYCCIALPFIPLIHDLSLDLELVWWPVNPGEPLVSAYPSWHWITGTCDHSWLFAWVWDLNSGPQAFTTCSLTCWATLLPHLPTWDSYVRIGQGIIAAQNWQGFGIRHSIWPMTFTLREVIIAMMVICSDIEDRDNHCMVYYFFSITWHNTYKC